MQPIRSTAAHLVAIAALAGCSGTAPAPPAPSVEVYQYAGSLQCTGGGQSLSAMAKRLDDAGVKVLGSACGSDGRFYPAMCGASDGRIGIFDIPAGQAAAASSAGFQPLTKRPGAMKRPCR